MFSSSSAGNSHPGQSGQEPVGFTTPYRACRDTRPRERGWNRDGLALFWIDAQLAEHGAMQSLWDRLHMTELWDEWVPISVWP